MVSMVVRHKDVVHLLKTYAVLLAVFAQPPQAHADIYDEGIGFSGQPIAISTASTTERYKFQHLFFKNFCKSNKK
jgi:hypothetical protein